MSAPRVLLVEVLDAAGGDVVDAREHVAALRVAGARVRAAILDPALRGAYVVPVSNGASAAAVASFGSARGDLEALRRFAREGYDLALVAAATPGGGAAAGALSSVTLTRWWPTGMAQASGWRARLGLGVPAAAALSVAGDEPDAAKPAGLGWSTVERGRLARGRLARGRFALWDGEYVLAPLPLAGEEGARILTAFAAVAAQRAALDLIVFAEPQPEFERQARGLGIGARVHFVGPAPREAEWAWWAHASAGLIAGRGPFAGGLVLRGLAVGCPLLVDSGTEPGREAAAWLARHGCTPWPRPGIHAETLAHVVERGPAVEQGIGRGLALAAHHEPKVIGSRCAAAMSALLPATIASRPAAAA